MAEKKPAIVNTTEYVVAYEIIEETAVCRTDSLREAIQEFAKRCAWRMPKAVRIYGRYGDVIAELKQDEVRVGK